MKTKYVNPFTEEYVKSEIEAFKIKESCEYKGLKIVVRDVKAVRLDGYGYKDFGVKYEKVPTFYIDGESWMGLTPMEVESHYMPIKLAEGRVGVGGLGMGYYVQRILDKEDVHEVVVYELNQDVIDFYYQNFGKHEKLTILNESVLDIENEEFDFFYNDIYKEGMDYEAIDHMAMLGANNMIGHYHFWTMEMMIFDMINSGHSVPEYWKHVYADFILNLINTKSILNLLGDGDNIFERFGDSGAFMI
jgi:hypothetical protein